MRHTLMAACDFGISHKAPILMTKFLEKNMRKVLEIKQKTFLSHSQPPPPSIPSSISTGYNVNNRISPSILLIIIIIAVIFFISGLLHLLVRFLLRPAFTNSDENEDLTALQGQLQQLFHLHDSGLDPSFIDALPVFNYKAIVGANDPFDCAVCLSEFGVEDKLRLLPKCSHAFHMDCIDTWLLSHSTCPICRASLVQDFNNSSSLSPRVLRPVLESGNDNSRNSSILEGEVNDGEGDLGQNHDEKHSEIGARESGVPEEKVVEVKLGKFRRGDEGSNEIGCAEARRCFSMGSFAYVLDDNLSLKVAIPTVKKGGLGDGTTISECGCDKSILLSKRDSFSMSKIWLSGRNRNGIHNKGADSPEWLPVK